MAGSSSSTGTASPTATTRLKSGSTTSTHSCAPACHACRVNSDAGGAGSASGAATALDTLKVSPCSVDGELGTKNVNAKTTCGEATAAGGTLNCDTRMRPRD